jgi:hypothetical protein
LARCDATKLAGTLSTQLFAGKTFAFRSPNGNDKMIYEIKSTANSCIALSSSKKAVSFSSARTTKRFPSLRCASVIQIVRPWGSMAETQPKLQPALRNGETEGQGQSVVSKKVSTFFCATTYNRQWATCEKANQPVR